MTTCHDHVLPAKVSSTDPDNRARGYEQKVIEDHYRWAKWKKRRIAARKSRKLNRA